MYDEQLHHDAVQFLAEGGKSFAAGLLLACNLSYYRSGDTWYRGDETTHAVHVTLEAPREAYNVLNSDSAVRQEIEEAIRTALPEDEYIKQFSVRPLFQPVQPGWQEDILKAIGASGVNNQAPFGAPPQLWEGLRFRSMSEVRVAQALEKQKVLFLPNCLIRLNGATAGKRQTKEVDFLVCKNGKWGILEVDGEPYHPPTRTVEDHERDRLFRAHGITIVEHFDAEQCYNKPDQVVTQFLRLLDQ